MTDILRLTDSEALVEDIAGRIDDLISERRARGESATTREIVSIVLSQVLEWAERVASDIGNDPRHTPCERMGARMVGAQIRAVLSTKEETSNG